MVSLIESLLHSITFVCYKNLKLNFILSDTEVTLLEEDGTGQLQMRGTSFGR